MQLTSKFALLAVALAYGATTVSALPVRESLTTSSGAGLSKAPAAESKTPVTSVTKDIKGKGQDLVTEPKSALAVDPLNHKVTGQNNNPSHEEATTKDTTVHANHKATTKVPKVPKISKHTKSLRTSRIAKQQGHKAKNGVAVKDESHLSHQHQQEGTTGASQTKNHKLGAAALKDETIKGSQTKDPKLGAAALKDETHPSHVHQQEETIKGSQTKDHKLGAAALKDETIKGSQTKDHKLGAAALKDESLPSHQQGGTLKTPLTKNKESPPANKEHRQEASTNAANLPSAGRL